jgi:hypothetical protein
LGISRHQRLAFHGSAERLRHRGIEVGDEFLDPLLQMLLGREVAVAEKPANQDREPNLDLLEPRSGSRPRGVLGREVEGDAVDDPCPFRQCLWR